MTDGTTTVNPATTVDFVDNATVSDLGGGVAGVSISSSPAINLGTVSGGVAIVTTNGNRQYCNINADTTFEPTSFPPDVSEMYDIDLCVQYSSSNYNINFADWVRIPSWANWTLPIVTTPYRQITFKLSYRGGEWCLMDVIGDFLEGVD